MNLSVSFTEWSAPSAIGIAGLGGGFEVGAEVSSACLFFSELKHLCSLVHSVQPFANRYYWEKCG